MTDARGRYAAIFARGDSTDRLQFFSDAVFAIAMTLLVLDIKLPIGTPADKLSDALVELWPQYFAYLVSFAIIAINWFTHHRKFQVIERFDTPLVWINLLLLVIVAFVPFPTSLLSEYGPETPDVVMYAATVAALAVVQWWLWAHARRAGLLANTVDDGVYRIVRAGLLPVPLVFGGSIVIAVFEPLLAMFSWFLVWPVSIVVDAVTTRRVQHDESGDRAATRQS